MKLTLRGVGVVFLAVVVVLGLAGVGLGKESVEERATWYFRTVLDADGDRRLSVQDYRMAADRFLVEESTTLKTDVTQDALKTIAKGDLNRDGYLDEKEFIHMLSDSGVSGKQIHLAFTIDPTEMIVIYITKDNTSSSTVEYGLQSGVYTYSATGYDYTYHVGYIEPWKGMIHRILLTGLQTNTQYYYRVGDDVDGFSDEYTFTTAPSELQPFSFGLVGDMGTFIPMGWDVTDRIATDQSQLPVDFYVHAGDIAYAGVNGNKEEELEAIWDLYGDQIEKIAAYRPYMTAVGNHESYFNYTSFKARYHMTGDSVGGVQNFWFSFNYSYAHFTFMSTEHDYCPGSEQYNWLVKDLSAAAANKQERPWMFVIGHRPMYCTDQDEWTAHNGESTDILMTCIEPLLHQYGVDLMFAGHQHVYERTYPVYNGTLVKEGLISDNIYQKGVSTAFIVQGNSGAFTDHTWVDPLPAWSAVRGSDYGYGRFVINETTLYYQAYELFTDFPSDEFWIVTK